MIRCNRNHGLGACDCETPIAGGPLSEAEEEAVYALRRDGIEVTAVNIACVLRARGLIE
jgi:hypothetical protein